jgi:hypothetical protein
VQSLYSFRYLRGATQLLPNSAQCLGHRVSSAPVSRQISKFVIITALIRCPCRLLEHMFNLSIRAGKTPRYPQAKLK